MTVICIFHRGQSREGDIPGQPRTTSVRLDAAVVRYGVPWTINTGLTTLSIQS